MKKTLEHRNIPELLAPAGNSEKLRIALAYGADAVYLAGKQFGLRKSAENFSNIDIEKAVKYANLKGKKVYVVLNGFLHASDMAQLPQFLDVLESIQPHGLIISDFGVMSLAKSRTTIPLHVSTQASVTNEFTAQYWKEAGASRIIVARELSIPECEHIKKQSGIEVEVFIHGAMCASYSGKCVISNYTAGRDSNRGGCIQSCRHTFDVVDTDTENIDYSTHIMNAKDLNTISLIPKLIEAGIDSLKIEGRMKSNMYLANTVTQYRNVLDNHVSPQEGDAALQQVSNRSFTPAFFENTQNNQTINTDFNGYNKSVSFIGTVKAIKDKKIMLVNVKSDFSITDTLELQSPKGRIQKFVPTSIQNMNEEFIHHTKGHKLVQIPFVDAASTLSIIRKNHG
ncbi:MAG: U32 family peptidase C-terminal domain-containing protein [Candidatus Margulisbacteria bacterium]|nr:U32 family peptidase C-terminal domain-containing protein [Candidatus Margulisiibacteriota bacterium]